MPTSAGEVQLPFLVQYGAVAWKLAAALIALVGLVAVRVARRARERRRARAEVTRYFASVTAPVLAHAEGAATISGTLRGGVASTLFVGERAHVARTGEPWLDYKGEHVELAAPVRVVRGTFVTVARGLPKGTPHAIHEALARDADGQSRVSRVLRRAAGGRLHRLAQVTDGDLVIARGVLGRRGGVDRLGVRSWLLDPEPGHAEIAVLAVSPGAPAAPLRWYSALALAALLAGGACAAMYALGQRALQQGRADPVSETLGSWNALVLAAAAPGSRDAALDELARRYPQLRTQLDGVR